MRGALSLQSVSRAFGPVEAVRAVSLDVAAGELVTLLGPSGCGKTTLLRIVAGLDRPDEGRVCISGADMTGVPAYRRPVNTVFQHYALFPHLTVERNVAFGLETARRPRDEVKDRVARALDLVRLGELGGRRIDELSGGQKQRVALARALVLEPEVLLLDEPLAALDAQLRKQMQAEIKALHARLGLTFVVVTHDQDEALALSDRIVVMNAGRVEQTGTPREIYERPRSRFLATFLGVRNVWREDGGWRAARAEKLRMHAADGAGRVAGTVEAGAYLGDRTEWTVRAGDRAIVVSEPSGAAGRSVGDHVFVETPEDALLRLEDA